MLKRFVAVVLLFSIVLVTAPVSAAELAGARTSLGSVNGVGPVSLRGVTIPQEGTIFNGDDLHVGPAGYAKVMLVAGHKLELGAGTKISIRQIENAVAVQVQSGNVAFTSAGKTALTLVAGPYQFTPEHNSSGNVAFVGSDAVGLRSIKGIVSVRLSNSKTTSTISQGQEKILTFVGQSKEPLAQLASALPMPLPAVPPPPQTPPAGRGITKTGWIAILATIGGAAAAIAVLATRGKEKEDTAAILARQQASQTVAAASSTAAQASTAASTVANVSNQTNAAIQATANLPPAVRASLTAQAQALSSAATATLAQIQALQTRLTNLQNQLATATPAQVTQLVNEINAATADLNTADRTLNQQITELNQLIARAVASGVQNTPPPPVINLIPPVPTGSPTTP